MSVLDFILRNALRAVFVLSFVVSIPFVLKRSYSEQFNVARMAGMI